jgi:ATP-dependent Lon protease
LPFDLSTVVFITLVSETIPGPLRIAWNHWAQRLYEWWLEIAKRYLVQRELEANGLKPELGQIDEAIRPSS